MSKKRKHDLLPFEKLIPDTLCVLCGTEAMRIRQINKAYANYIHLKVKNDFGIGTRRETSNSLAKIPNLYHKSNWKTDCVLELSPSTPRGKKTPPKIFQETRGNVKKMWTCQHAGKAKKEK